MDADAIELRVLGCLLEKQRTTPDDYPLSLNALRLACNQTTNRDPVVSYDESRSATRSSASRAGGWARLASGRRAAGREVPPSARQELGLAADEVAVLCVLMLRGAQTPGELKQRTERLHRFRQPRATFIRPSTRLPDASSSSGSSAGRARKRSATASSSAATRPRSTRSDPAVTSDGSTT